MPRKGHILVVEDDAAVADFIEEILVEEGYSVRRSSEGTGALTALAARLPDLILCDLHLPGASGLTLIDDIRATIGAPVRIVVMTADAQAAKQLALLGVAFCLLKPFTLEELLNCVATHIRPQRPALG